MSNWQRVRAHLISEGRLSPTGIGRRVQARTCRECHAPVLAGLDADRCALVTYCDPDPLSPLGEALAVLAGRRTIGLWVRLGGYQFHPRDQWSIAGTPAGQGRYDVLAAHRCGAPPLPTIASVHQPPQRTPTPTVCPF